MDSPPARRPPPKVIASLAGIALAVGFPFFPYDRLAAVWPAIADLPNEAIPLTVTAIVAGIGFGLRRRRPAFYQIRLPRWSDLGAMLLCIPAAYALAALVTPFVRTPGDLSAWYDGPETPLWTAIAGVVATGVCEEFLFRGFVIEELGELLRNRGLAAGIALVGFALAHGTSGYGWTSSLLIPGVVGATLTFLYFWRRNLPVCMLMHTLIDLLHTLQTRG